MDSPAEPLHFPDPRRARHDGLVAIGGDLSIQRLLLAYRSGIFPWSIAPITWWSPDPRGVIDMDCIHISCSLARTLRQHRFEVTFDRAFREVIEGCAQARRPDGATWISVEFMDAYTALYDAGYAHSVECWQDGKLAGGLYGVAVGGLFAGESMFHFVDDASKVAVVRLVEHLKTRGFSVFDTQMVTPITASLGAIEISRAKYLNCLKAAVGLPCQFS
ncbi:MAG: leucyl/phenylalanyl-tRNA--protein transferase [Pedosphaera sp.]|nr:leucyl/phenylalanyl-tRNA--protein transferase [Pedosphaera sp.]